MIHSSHAFVYSFAWIYMSLVVWTCTLDVWTCMLCTYTIYNFPYIWHRSLHLVSDPGLQRTALDVHREDSMPAPSFRKSCDTRNKLCP